MQLDSHEKEIVSWSRYIAAKQEKARRLQNKVICIISAPAFGMAWHAYAERFSVLETTLLSTWAMVLTGSFAALCAFLTVWMFDQWRALLDDWARSDQHR